MTRVTRREFVRLGATGAAAAPFVLDPARPGAATVTAQEIADRIRKAVGVEWKADTVDGFKAGDPATAVTGVVTTALATIDVLRQAVKGGANLIVTAGPTFYSRADSANPPADPVVAAKRALIAANRLVVWRFSDHWRRRVPDPFALGLMRTLGWEQYRTATDAVRVRVPPVALEAIAATVKTKLGSRGGLRIVGNPRTRVRTIGVLAGTVPIQTTLAVLPQVDAIVAGEIREWESSEYARDVVHAGQGKALLLVGRTLSEEGGMRLCAEWLQAMVPETAVRSIAAGDPYWRPAV